MTEFLSSLTGALTLAFAVTSMFSMGLRLTVNEIIAPLRNVRLVIMALAANFVIVPVVAELLGRLLIAQEDLQTGLILLSAAAGAPMIPKLAGIARGNVRFAVGLVVLLVVGTVLFLPLVLPLLLPGVSVDGLDIALRLFLQLLLPLAAGLFVKARYEEEAADLLPTISQIANVSLALMLVLQLALNIREVFGLFGSGAILAIGLLLGSAMIAGYVLGGPDSATRRVLAVGTGQRNLAAALVVGTGNFADRPDVLVMLAAAGLLGMIVVIPVAGEFGRRSAAAITGATARASPPEPIITARDPAQRS
jgi:predicted Na+-dependent transporter